LISQPSSGKSIVIAEWQKTVLPWNGRKKPYAMVVNIAINRHSKIKQGEDNGCNNQPKASAMGGRSKIDV
jgi:hypothetical protein